MQRSVDDWLIVIDMQRVYADPASPWYVPGFDTTLGIISSLVAGFGERVVLTRFLAPPQPEGGWEAYYSAWPFALQDSQRGLFDLAEPFNTLDVPLLELSTFSKFGPELEALTGRDASLVLCGVSTECCVLATALAAADAGHRSRIVADACASVSPQAHEAALLVARTGFWPLVEISDLGLERAREKDDRRE